MRVAMPRHVLILSVAITLMAAAGHADPFDPPDPATKTGAWRGEWLEPGGEWWCHQYGCRRERAACDDFLTNDRPCKRQKKVWAFSAFTWDENGVTGYWWVSESATRAACARDRRNALKDDTKVSVSPCVAVGDKTTDMPRRPAPWMPPGSGWWCHRFAADGRDWSACERFEIDCQRIAQTMASLEQKKHRGVRVLAPCRALDRAWAYVKPGDEAKGYDPTYVIRETEAECVAEGGKDNCRAVP
jgi:hypothetical protein